MISFENTQKAILKFAWGYFFLYFNINIGTLNILPSFVGYLLFLSAIGDLSQEEKSIKLLKPFGIILCIWEFISWILDAFAVGFNLSLIVVLIGIIEIYFHFQALTNIASIATKFQKADMSFDKKFLALRTIQSAMLTVLTVFNSLKMYFNEYVKYMSIAFAIVALVVSLIIMFTMFSFRKNIDKDKFQTAIELSDTPVIKPVENDTEE